MPSGFMRQKYYSPAELGFNATSIDTSADGTFVDCDGYDKVTLMLFHDYAAATGVELYLQVKDDQDIAHYVTVQEDETGGVFTLYKWKMQYTTGADAYWEAYIDCINAKQIRIADALGQGSPSGDKLTASMLLAYAGD